MFIIIRFACKLSCSLVAHILYYCYYIVHSLVTCFLLPQLIFTPYQPFLTHPAYDSNCDCGLLTISELIVDIFVKGKEDNIWDLIYFYPSANCMLLLTVLIAKCFVCSSLPCIFLFPPYHCTLLLSLLEALNNMHN